MKLLPQYKNPWKTKSKQFIYNNSWIKIEEHQVVNPAGGDGIYGVVHYHNLALAIIPFDGTHTWLVGQYRYPLEEYNWEIPAGGGPFGEDILEAAKRELLEETGITASSWKVIQKMQISNSTGDEIGYIYLAETLEFGSAQPTDEEELSLIRIPIQEAFDRVRSGELTDSLTVAGLQRLEIMMLRNEI
ncbi:MAG: ADP-ribose pyrophosphatase [Limisphaerales bacterium]|jgi:ADP-ribose pyrophosphatase